MSDSYGEGSFMNYCENDEKGRDGCDEYASVHPWAKIVSTIGRSTGEGEHKDQGTRAALSLLCEHFYAAVCLYAQSACMLTEFPSLPYWPVCWMRLTYSRSEI